MKLSTFKPSLKKIIIVAACLLLIVAFIPFSGSNMGASKVSSAVKVGKYNINPNTIRAEIANYMQMYQMQGMQPSQQDIYNILNYSLQNNVVKYLYINEADKLGIQIDDSILNNLIATNPYFQNEEGKFDKERFAQLINSQFKNESEFKKALATDVVLTMFSSALSTSLELPNDVLDYAYKGLTQTRNIEYVAINKRKITDIPEITQEFIDKTYQDSKAEFTVPEYRSAEVIYFDITKLAKAKPSNEEVNKYYNDNIANYREEDLYDISQAVFADEKSAKEMEAKIKASEIDEKSEEFVDLGSVGKSSIQAVYNHNIANQKVGSFSKVLKTNAGYSILFLKHVVDGRTIPLSEVREGIESNLAAQKQQLLIDNTKLALSSKAKDANLADLAKQEALFSYAKYENIDNKGVSKNNQFINVLGSNATLDALFSVGLNNNSSVMQDGSNFYIVKVTNIEKSFVKAKEDVMPSIIAKWQEKEQHTKAIETANAIFASSSNVANLKAADYTVQKSSVSLLDNNKDSLFSYGNKQSLFNLPMHENTIIDNPNSDFVVVAKVVGIRSSTVDKKQYDAFRYNFAELLSQLPNISFLNYLYNSYEVEINEERLSQAIFSQQ